MKAYRLLFLAVATVLLLAVALWFRAARAGFATPNECLSAYYLALLNADADALLECLTPRLRYLTQREHAGAERSSFLRAATSELKGWALVEREVDGAAAQATIEEQYLSGRKRVRFRLENTGGGWLIADVSAVADLPTIIPYGMHEKELLPKP